MSVYDCQNCGHATGRCLHQYAEVVQPDTSELLTGDFITCIRCHSVDVDLYSDEGWQIELRAREVQEKTPQQRALAFTPGRR